MAWVIAVSGILIPWLVGLGVKLWLSAIDRPTYPISDFVNPLTPVLLLVSAAQWSFPFLVLAALVRLRPVEDGEQSFRRRIKTARTVHFVGLAAAVPLFVGVFREFDFMYLFVPMGGFLVPPMLGTYALLKWVRRKRGEETSKRDVN